MDEELKACLRCGCADITDADYGQEYWCQCTVCGLRTKSFSSRIAADMDWNTRAHAPSQGGGEAVARVGIVPGTDFKSLDFRIDLQDMAVGTKLYTHPADQVAEPDAELVEAVKFAARSLAQITSSDGSGHADIAVGVLRMAGFPAVEREALIDDWKSKAQWRIDAKLASLK